MREGCGAIDALFRRNGADARRLLVEAGHVFVASVGDELAIDFLRGAHGVIAFAAGGLRAMAAAVKIHADFIMINALVK